MSSDPTKWRCGMCQFDNPLGARSCEICLTTNPNAAAPEKNNTATEKANSNIIDNTVDTKVAEKKGTRFLRRKVPKDNNCLFSSFNTLLEGKYSKKLNQDLRDYCGEKVLADTEKYNDALLQKSNSDYAEWIKQPNNWGGDIEIEILAKKFNVNVAVVSMHQSIVLPFDYGHPGWIYILYTGQHYDAMVAAESDDAPTSQQTCVISPQDVEQYNELAILFADEQLAAFEKAQTQRVRKVLKCGGCGHICNDNDDFQEHCMTVEHDDDFLYECEEVTIIEDADAPLPEGVLDLSKCESFYNTEASPFSVFAPAAVTVDDVQYRTVYHFLVSTKLGPVSPDAVEQIKEAKTTSAVLMLENSLEARDDWDAIRDDILLAGLRAKFDQKFAEQSLLDALLATEKPLACIDTNDLWLGVDATGGVPKGKNKLGEILTTIREELRSGK